MKKIILFALPFVILLVAAAVFFIGNTPDNREEIVISIPYNEYIRNIDTNYYKLWLEEQTGLSIKFNIIYEAPSADYLRSMFASGYIESDAFFSMLGGEDFDEWNNLIQEFGEKGYILPLNDYIEQSLYLNVIFDSFTDYDLREVMTSPDGNIYYMPGLDPSVAERHFGVMWLNQTWLKTLNLNVPQTTDDLRDVLYAFRQGNPNGNELRTEIPLAGSYDVLSEQVCNAIINAFVYNNPENSRLFLQNGAVRFAPITDEWREAMKYLNGLYADGLIDPFSYSHNILTNLANSPWDVLGGFTSQSVTDVLFQNNAELINAFLHIAPLAGPDGTRNATVRTPLPRPAGVITSNCKNPEAVFKLFDLMMSEEAFLIGRYGEENVDWVRADITDTDFYGNRASVRVINHLRNRVQNKNINEIGPFFAYPAYADGVTFLAFDISYEYKNARAYRTYERYKPSEYISTTIFHNRPEIQHLRRAIDAYTEESIEAFVTGAADPFNDTAWEAHLQKYRTLGIEKFIESVAEVLR
jgi:putative aldouronate transport system substrate-binding protein